MYFIIGFLMLAYGLLVRTGLKYGQILAVGGRGFGLWLLKVEENVQSPVSLALHTVIYCAMLT